jgi:hypothetical protein
VGRAGKGSRLDASTPAKEAGRGRGAPVRNQAGGGLAGEGRLLRECMLGVDRDPVGASVARREVRVDFFFLGRGGSVQTGAVEKQCGWWRSAPLTPLSKSTVINSL